MFTPHIQLPPGRQPVRVFVTRPDHDPIPLMPLIDIAAAIGSHRNHLFRIIKRNPRLFEGWTKPVTVTVTGSSGRRDTRQLLCATREGIIACLVKVSYDRIKDPVSQERIIAFQRWQPERWAEAEVEEKERITTNSRTSLLTRPPF